MKFRPIVSNIVCAFIPNKKMRSKVRVVLNNPSIKKYIKLVRRWADKNCGGVRKLSIEFGVGCHNLVVLLNDMHVFKFFLVPGRESRAYHEVRVLDTFRKITPIRFPEIELIKYAGTVVRRYEYIPGKLLTDFSPDKINQHREKIAKQLANFLYVIGCSDPVELRDLKPAPDARPGYLYGWFHNDIGNNFMLDDDFNIVGFIDCEKMAFCDFKESLSGASHFWDKNDIRGLMISVLAEYANLYYCQNKKSE